MGFFDRFKRKKKTDDLFSDLEKLDIEKTPKESKEIKQSQTKTSSQTQLSQNSDFENIKAKLDLLLTEIDSLKTQNQNINEKLKSIEKTLADMKGIRYY
ncbi:MAG: hypothetical protein J7J93_02070 [Candidatus Aenigmarchaeota archaeon]|nr:hypothetical protein [Candidatus Aenigmarchaeota archaeon]